MVSRTEREKERGGCARLFRIEGLVDGPVDPIERHDKREEEEEEVRIGQTEVALFPRFLLRLSAFLTRILSPLRIFSRFRDSCAPAPSRIFFFFFFFLLFLLFRLPSRFLSVFSPSFTLRSPPARAKKRSRRGKYPEGEIANPPANPLL